MAYIEFKDVIKAYGEGDARIHALDGASFTVERGELASFWVLRVPARPRRSTFWAAWIRRPPAP